MKRFVISIVQFTAQMLAVIFMFIPGMYLSYTYTKSWSDVAYTLRYTEKYSLAEIPSYNNPHVFAIHLIIMFACASACLSLWAINVVFHYNKTEKLQFCTKRICLLAPILQLAVFIFYTILACGTWHKTSVLLWETEVYVLFFFELALLLTILLLDLFKFFVKIPQEAAVKKPAEAAEPAASEQVESLSVIEQLEKYKELLDKGVITEAEFTEKKKQLLGL